MVHVLLADDHPLFRNALATAVAKARPDAHLIEADNLKAAQTALAEDDDIVLVLLDLKLPDTDGFSGLIALRKAFPDVPVAVVSASEDRDTIRRALHHGAAGFIPKSASFDKMTAALTALFGGEIYGGELGDGAAGAPQGLRILTPAQQRILTGLQQGRLNKQIAYEIGVTEATVKAHLTAIFKKLGVQNRTQAVIAAKSMNVLH